MTGPENEFSQVERQHIHAAPGLGGRVCVVVGDEDGNGVFFAFLKINDSHTFKDYRPARNFKKSKLPTYKLIFISSPPNASTA